jgi:hypothetical protein
VNYGSASNTLVVNNTCVNTPGYGIYSAATNTQITNNLLVGTAGIVNMGTASLQTNLTGGNPGFVNAAAKDFRILSGSSAIDAGTGVSAVTTDSIGTPRPRGRAYDVGAFEYTGN